MPDTMARKRTTEPDKSASANRKTDRHKPRRMVALTLDVYGQLQELAERNNRPLSWELRRILLDVLKSEGLWPPPGPAGAGP